MNSPSQVLPASPAGTPFDMSGGPCRHELVLKTAAQTWACSKCRLEFFPERKSRFKNWREVRRMKRDLRGWNAEE